jgi:putative acetyltransferase
VSDIKRIKIRLFEAGDASRVQEMHIASFARLARGEYTADEIAAHEQMFRAPKYLNDLSTNNLVVAVLDDDIVGSAGWCQHDHQTARIRKVFVSAALARSGIGRMMMERIEKTIQETGFRRIVLRASMNAVAFYERVGYQRVEESKMVLGTGVSVSVTMMDKELVEA